MPACFLNSIKVHLTHIQIAEHLNDIKKLKELLSFPTHANLEQLAQLLADGTIKAEINTVYSLADVKQAHRQCEGKRGRGRILLELYTIK
ncbi:zinc-binding dehydrogenase [Paenibacillus sp. MCAF9]|uniref:zinc-binding dehydrogenase n=1 Tax=Paenibacillus sp. MCAF9 TaxID=3233046 RepID=UPI003F9B4E3A